MIYQQLEEMRYLCTTLKLILQKRVCRLFEGNNVLTLLTKDVKHVKYGVIQSVIGCFTAVVEQRTKQGRDEQHRQTNHLP